MDWLSYGPDQRQIPSPCRDYVDKILKGAKPADRPVEQSLVELVINLTAAIPASG